MINLSLIPILVFIILLLPIAIMGFFKSLRWSIVLLGLILISGGISFLITSLFYDSILYKLFENMMVWRLGSDMALDQMGQISKITIIGFFVSIFILPLFVIVILIFKILTQWLNKPLGPKTTKISNNEKKITRKNLRFQKIGAGVISTSTALILASTLASSLSIILTPASKNKFFSKVIKPLSFPLNYGNGYDKDWQRLYSFLDSAKENRVEIKGLRELINFSSFQGDFSSEIDRLNDSLTKIDTSALNEYFSTIEDSSKLTDIALRVLLGKFSSGLTNKIMAHEKIEVKDEQEFEKFLTELNAWAENITKQNLYLNNKLGVKEAILKLLNQNHDYKNTYYYKNKNSVDQLIKDNQLLLAQSKEEYKKLVAQKEDQMQLYNSNFKDMQKIASGLQTQIDDFINKWKRIGSGSTAYASNYPQIPQIINDFVNKGLVNKDLHSNLPILYSEKNGKSGPGTESAPSGRILLDYSLTAQGSLTTSNTLIQKYINAYKDVFGQNGSENSPEINSPKQIFMDAQSEYEDAREKTSQALGELNDFKNEKNQIEKDISITEDNLKDSNKLKDSYIRERDNLVNSINNQIDKLSNKKQDKDNAQNQFDKAKNEYNDADDALNSASQNKISKEADLDKVSRNDSNYQNLKNALEKAKKDENSAEKDFNTKEKNLNNASKKLDSIKQQYDSMESKLQEDINRLNQLQGGSASSSTKVSIITTVSSGLIHDEGIKIGNYQNDLNQLIIDLQDVNKEISDSQNNYNNLKSTEDDKKTAYEKAKSVYEPLLKIHNDAKDAFEKAKSDLDQILSNITQDINKIQDYVNSVPSEWNYFVDNSISKWQIQGIATSFNPPINNIPNIIAPDKSDPSWISWEPEPYDEIDYNNKNGGGASIVYLENKLKYLQEVLVITREIEVSMSEKYTQRIDSIADAITKTLT